MRSLRFTAITIFVLIVSSVFVYGQSDRGTIRGAVTDPNGAAVANARVVLTGIGTGEVREATTSEEGAYVFPELRPVNYRITVEAPGFQQATTEDIKVGVQVTHTANIQLQVGAVTNQVTVTTEGEAIQADTVVIQTNVNERQVKELPLLVNAESGGRTPLAFIFLDSNVNSTEAGSASASQGGTNASRFRVSGGQALGTEILIDGASTRRAQNGTFFSEVSPGPNAFQEFTLSTSTFSAEFGNSSGGIVNFVLKSGTNDFHGEVYNLLRNEKFNANTVRNKINGFARDRDNQNNFGFNIGGPVGFLGFGEGTKPYYLLRDRAFFFFNYEGYRFTEGETAIVTVPTLRMRNGDFGELLTDPDVLRAFPGGVRIYNPRQPVDTRQPFAGNIIPASAFDPAGFNALQAYPLPNRPGVFRNYVTSSTRPNNMNQFTIKTDVNLTNSQRLTVSYSRRDFERIQGFTDPTTGRPRFPRFAAPATAIDVWNQEFKSNYARIQHNWNITPTVLNFLNIGYTFYDVINANTTEGFNTSSLGIPAGSTTNTAFPRILIDIYGEPTTSSDPRAYQSIGSTFFTDRIRDGAFEVSDFVTVVTGRHTIKLGADVRIQQFNVFQRIDPGGTFRFTNNQTARNDDPNGGWPIASLITGAIDLGFTRRDSIDPAFNQISHSYFVQDDFKLTPKLTLNLGVRYDLPGFRTERFDRFRTFDPNVANPAANNRLGALVGVEGAGALGTRPRGLIRTDKTNIGPRVGAAYAFDNKTVIRAGAGLYYSPILYGAGGGNEPTPGLIGYNTSLANFPTGPGGRQATQFLSTYPALPAVDPTGQFIGQDVQYFDENFRTGRTLQYSVDFQRELPFNFVASVSYIGSRADRQRSNFGRPNALPFNALGLGFEILDAPLSRITNPGPGDVAFANAARARAQALGIALPTSTNAVFTGFNGRVAQALRPFPQYGNVTNLFESRGESTYDSLRARFERRFSNGIQAGFSYTLSRLVTNASEDLFGGDPQSGVLQNPFVDPEDLKTVSPNNPPQVFVANFLAELPFGRGRRFLNQGGIVNALVGGFQVAGIFRYQSGTPIVAFTTQDVGFLNRDIAGYNGNLRLNLTGQPLGLDNDLRLPSSNAPGRILVLNRAAFARPTNFTNNAPALLVGGALNPAYTAYYSDVNRFFGTSPAVITDFRSDPFFSEDMSILKKTRITENVTLELGAEFFNVFNRVRYGLLNTDFISPDFGTKQLIERPRVIQLRGRVIF